MISAIACWQKFSPKNRGLELAQPVAFLVAATYLVLMIQEAKVILLGEEVINLGPYRPWSHHAKMGGDSSNYPTHSGRILDIKDNKPSAVAYFFEYMRKRLRAGGALAIVPSHDPDKKPGGLHALVEQLSAACGKDNAAQALVRHTKIAKLAGGGDRDPQVHLESIYVPNPALVAGKRVVLIDDVTTSGGSFSACKQLLLGAGANEVRCVALGHTTY